jgi:hypothetical protein
MIERSVRPLIIGLVLALLLLDDPRSVLAQGPRVEVLSYTPRLGILGGQPYVFVRGMLQNRGPGVAHDIQIALQVFGSDPVTPIGVGGGVSWLDSLDAGESGPFSLAIRHCCPEDFLEYAFAIDVGRAGRRPYRQLSFEQVTRWDADAPPRLTGWIRNRGDAFLNAPSVDIYASFWSGEEMVALETARLPILYSLEGPTGQSLPPGAAYPWSMQLPEADFDRYELWHNGDPYPEGSFPVPLGYLPDRQRREGSDIVLEGSLRHCGREAVTVALLMLVGRDGQGRVLDFKLLQLITDEAIPPGSLGRLVARWPDAPADLDPAEVTLLPLALDVQDQRPASFPCAPPVAGVYLPMLARDLP